MPSFRPSHSVSAPTSSRSSADAPLRAVVATLHARVALAEVPRRRSVGARRGRPSFVLEVASDAAWFRAQGGALVDCRRRSVLRRILLALVHAPVGRACTLDELVGIGWPGEKMSRPAARNRVHVSLCRLRALGLGRALVATRAGYLLHPDVVRRVVDPGP